MRCFDNAILLHYVSFTVEQDFERKAKTMATQGNVLKRPLSLFSVSVYLSNGRASNLKGI